VAGHAGEARTILRQASAQPWETFNIGRAWAALGEKDSAFVWLERANWRWPHRAPRDDPALDAMRSDPRFAELVERVDRQMGVR
jgi:hypothetical protein